MGWRSENEREIVDRHARPLLPWWHWRVLPFYIAVALIVAVIALSIFRR